MSTDPGKANLSSLKTATAVADPVLIRLTSGASDTFLLADDAGHDCASTIRLRNVRWVRSSRGLRSLLARALKPRTGFLAELSLQKSQQYVAAIIPTQACTRVPAEKPHYSFINLSREQFFGLRASTAARFASQARLLTRTLPARRRIVEVPRVALVPLRYLLDAPRRLAMALARP